MAITRPSDLRDFKISNEHMGRLEKVHQYKKIAGGFHFDTKKQGHF
jgi:hypothetical protein